MIKERQHLDRLYDEERSRYLDRIPGSLAMLERSRGSMPNGVPMTWMVGLYDHPPLFVSGGQGAYITDVDGNRYLDMNHADMSMSCGYGHAAIAAAVSGQVARGSQFLLPHELSVEVSELLAERFGLGFWQYTLSASIANRECINIARRHTGRRRILTFDGSYHGHIRETLNANSAQNGLPAGSDSVRVQYNDLDAAERVLRSGEVALVLMEPAMTNVGVVKPDPEFLLGLRALSRSFGSLLLVDETHTHVCAYGGLTREWGIDPDFVVAGKSIAGGVPMGVYGMTGDICRTLEDHTEYDHWPEEYLGNLSLGGTLFGYPLALAAARAVLTEILTPANHERVASLGGDLADGLDRIISQYGLPWSACRLFCRSGVCYSKSPPRNVVEARAAADFGLNRLQRLFMANRGIWEAIATAGPAVSFEAGQSEVERYLDVYAEFVDVVSDRAEG